MVMVFVELCMTVSQYSWCSFLGEDDQAVYLHAKDEDAS